jgi:hypothetical protein
MLNMSSLLCLRPCLPLLIILLAALATRPLLPLLGRALTSPLLLPSHQLFLRLTLSPRKRSGFNA